MSKDTPDPADPIESEREDDETPSQPVEADDPERVDTVDEMTVDEMIEAEKDPAHPRHEDVMEANRQMAEKFRGSCSRHRVWGPSGEWRMRSPRDQRSVTRESLPTLRRGNFPCLLPWDPRSSNANSRRPIRSSNN